MSDFLEHVPPVIPALPPRHQNIARTLMREIAEGVYPVGSKLPKEVDLCRHFGSSRHTLRVALAHLVRAGIIERRPRLGTVVVASEPIRAYHLNVQALTDLQQHGEETYMRVIERQLEIADGQQEQALAPYEGQQWLFVKGLRFSDQFEAPISYHEVWVHPDYRSVDGVSGNIHKSIFLLIEEQFGVDIVRMRQTIQSAKAEGDVALQLRVPSGTACLWVRREFVDMRNTLVEFSLSVHPGNLFTYEMTIEKASPPGRSVPRSPL